MNYMNYTPLLIFTLVLQACCASEDETVVINETFDQNLPGIRKTISQNSFDPLRLPNISSTLFVKIFFFNESITLNLTKGLLFRVSTIERAGNFYLTFHPRTIRLHGLIHFEELKGKFNFSYDTRYYSDEGMLDATLKNVTATLNVDFKLLELLLINPRITVKDYGSLHVTITSHALLSPLTNIVANVVVAHYKKEVLNLADGLALDIVQQILKKVNKNLPQWVLITVVNLVQGTLNGRLGQELNSYYSHKNGENRNNKKL